MKNPVLYFFLLVLQVSFNFTPDVVNKRSGFFETLLKEGLKIVLSKESNPVTLNLSFLLLLAEVDLILKEQGCKKDALVARGTDRVKMIFKLLAEVITLYM